jgi:hypothetical protein
MHRSRIALALALLAVCLTVASTAQGQGAALGTDLFPWPELLPPAQIPNDVQASPVAHCRKPSIRCVRGLERRLQVQWQRFDANCDHRAVIAYSYLQITKGLLEDMRGPRPGLVRNRRWMASLITAFSNRYFRAFHSWEQGRPVPEPWRIAFETIATGDLHAGQEVLLFSNAHVQHDLPFAYEQMGLRTPAGGSRKPDHDAVNEVNARVFDGIEKFIAANYDPSFTLLDVPVVAVEELGVLEMVKLWREGAWRSAEHLLAAQTPAEREEVAETIADVSANWAQMISAVRVPGYGAMRDNFCTSRPGYIGAEASQPLAVAAR